MAPVLVADGARADNAAGAHVAGLADVGDQLAEVKGHLGAGLAHADLAAVPGALQRQVQTALVPGIADFIQRDRDRAEGGGRLALEKAKALGQLAGNQVAQRHVVGQHHQAYAFERLLRRGAHGHVSRDHGDFGLKVDAELLGQTRDDHPVRH